MNSIHPQPAGRPAYAWVLAAGLLLASFGLAAPQETEVLPISGVGVSADSNHRMIAVTGVDLTGASVLYLVDTIDYRLAVYQASAGAESSQGIKLIGARRIDLDLKLHGLNDRSKYTYEDLRAEFAAQGLIEGDETPGAQVGD